MLVPPEVTLAIVPAKPPSVLRAPEKVHTAEKSVEPPRAAYGCATGRPAKNLPAAPVHLLVTMFSS